MSYQILVIDDESITRRLVSHILKQLNVSVLTAEDGAEALQVADQNTIHLAFVDINLPDMDGFTLLQKLKEIPHLEDIPMYIFTARNSPDDRDVALELGAAGFFYKPFSTQELRDLVTQHMD